MGASRCAGILRGHGSAALARAGTGRWTLAARQRKGWLAGRGRFGVGWTDGRNERAAAKAVVEQVVSGLVLIFELAGRRERPAGSVGLIRGWRLGNAEIFPRFTWSWWWWERGGPGNF